MSCCSSLMLYPVGISPLESSELQPECQDDSHWFALLQTEVHPVTSTGLVVLMLSWTVCAWMESQRNNQFQASAVARRLRDKCRLECRKMWKGPGTSCSGFQTVCPSFLLARQISWKLQISSRSWSLHVPCSVAFRRPGWHLHSSYWNLSPCWCWTSQPTIWTFRRASFWRMHWKLLEDWYIEIHWFVFKWHTLIPWHLRCICHLLNSFDHFCHCFVQSCFSSMLVATGSSDLCGPIFARISCACATSEANPLRQEKWYDKMCSKHIPNCTDTLESPMLPLIWLMRYISYICIF